MRSAWVILFSIAPLFSQTYPAPSLVFSKTFGGRSGSDAATALAVDPNGNVAVIGTTGSPDFPVTNAYLPNAPYPPLIAVAQNGWTFPNLGAAVDVLAMASTRDGSVVYATSDSGVFRSADGGATWTQQLPGLAGANSIAVDGANSNTVYAVISGYLGNASPGAFKSTDGGQNWTSIAALRYLPFLFTASLQCPAKISGTIYATDNGFYRSRDAGATWQSIGPNNNNVFSFALAASDPGVVYTVSSDGFVYRSADGGDTWTKPGGMFPAYPSADNSSYAYSLAVDPQNENTVWALELNGNLYRSIDGGATFSIALSDPAERPSVFLSVSPSGQSIIVSSRGGSEGGSNAIVSYDSGATWTRVNTPSTVNSVLAGQNAFFLETDVHPQGFLTKWSADGSHMIFSTFLPSTPVAVATDAAGNTYVAGNALMKFDPYGSLVFSQSLGTLAATAMIVGSNIYLAAAPINGVGGQCGTAQAIGTTIMKLDLQGNSIFSQTVPQVCGSVSSMLLDSSGAIYLSGYTYSNTLATTPTAVQSLPILTMSPGVSNGFLAVLTPQADQITYLSYLPGPTGLALDASGNVLAAGGANGSIPFTPTSIITGETCTSASSIFGFVIKLSLSSSTPLWLTEIGAGCNQPTSASQIAVDANGSVWVGGQTSSGLFPTFAPFEVQGTDQGFLVQLNGDGQMKTSSYAPSRFALGPMNAVYAAGISRANKVDTQIGPQYPGNAIVEKIGTSATRPTVIDSINQPSADVQTLLLGIAPGEMIHITGRGLGPVVPLSAQFDFSGRVATSLGGIQVLFNGVPAPLISVQASTIVCMTPFELSGASTASVQIVQNGVSSPAVLVGVKPVAYLPIVLSVVNQNGTLNTQATPAHMGQSVTIYVTGFGDTTPSVPDGSIYQSPLPVPLYKVSTPLYAPITYAGPAPGLVAGIWQVNVTLTPGAFNGNPAPVYIGSTYVNGTGATQEAVAQVWIAP
jgi:uncharacterized protein (TIGR03437 family)